VNLTLDFTFAFVVPYALPVVRSGFLGQGGVGWTIKQALTSAYAFVIYKGDKCENNRCSKRANHGDIGEPSLPWALLESYHFYSP
jgi:hypothetical protein